MTWTGTGGRRSAHAKACVRDNGASSITQDKRAEVGSHTSSSQLDWDAIETPAHPTEVRRLAQSPGKDLLCYATVTQKGVNEDDTWEK